MSYRNNRFTSWSFSRWGDWLQCPLRAKLKHLDKLKEPTPPAFERGIMIHEDAANYVKGTLKALPLHLAPVQGVIDELRDFAQSPGRVIVEDDWAFTRNWRQTVWNDWKNCWVRIKLDVAHQEDHKTLVVTDWKSGKYHKDLVDLYQAQLELYALGAFLKTKALRIRPRLVYTDLGKVHEVETYTRDDVQLLQNEWEDRVEPMMTATEFPATPNDKCKWCFYRKSNGGPCKENQ
jgi:CRISPR/Cas system-associated exonuclease Cas4 (RecB family)